MVIDLLGNEMKDLNENAYDWIDQTVLRRIEDCVRCLKVHGILDEFSAANAKKNIYKLIEKNKL